MKRQSTFPLLPLSFWIDIGLIILSIFLFILTLDYPQMASTFPRLVLIMILVVTLLDMAVTFRIRLKEITAEKASENGISIQPKKKLKVLYMAVLMFAFFFFMILFGVILGTFLFTFISGWTLGYRKLKILLLSSAIITASVYLIFIIIMKSFLPQGLIFSVIGG